MKPKKALMIEYKIKDVMRKALLVPDIASNESLLIVKCHGKIHFVHIIGEKLGSGHELGYYYLPNNLPVPRKKEDYHIIKEIEIDSSDVLEDALLFASHQPGFRQAERFFKDLL